MRLLIMNWLSYLEFYVILIYSISAAVYDLEESESCYCVKLADCPPLLERFSSNPDPRDVEYLNSQNCGYVGLEPKVCCPETPLVSNECEPEYRSRSESVLRSKLLPDDACGISSARRIFGGENAKLGAYPWMARLGYTHPNKFAFIYKCGGSLINTRFVITTAHCITHLNSQLRLAIVRLGEHDIRNNLDCEGEICADLPQDFKPLSVFAHRDYNRPTYRNDIGLIRLDREAMITPWVSPICLPYKNMRTDYTGFDVTAAGWGVIFSPGPSSPVLQHVTLKVADFSNCKTVYTLFKVNIGSTQFCTKGQNDKDTCDGDSGGPLMLETASNNDRKYFLLGITSFGYKRCGPSGIPGVSTNVVEYLDWILYHIDDDCRI